MKLSIALFVTSTLFLLTAVTGSAQELLPLERLKDTITLDGLSDEPAWDGIAPLPMTMYQPTFQGTMTERTEIRVGYDDTHLYFAGRFYDSDSSGVLVSSLNRDGGTAADDYFNIALDPFNDNENALWFWTNPAGLRGDAALSDDAEGNNVNSWDTFWDVATVQNEEGWFAEVRIPFSSLSFQNQGARVVMGLAVSRVISRKNERHVFPAIPPNWALGFVKPSVAQDVTLEGVSSQKPIYFTPYALGGSARVAQPREEGASFVTQDDFSNELGLDLKYNVTSNLTLDASVNTDFAQIEADDQQVNLTRFSLFFPEKRPFFQERAGIFDFFFGMQERLFHSRQIGLHEGQPVRILGGVRLVGRVGDWDVGALDMQTARREALPSENFGVVRLRRNLFNENSYAGGIATSRIGADGRYDLAYGLDGIFRVVGDEYLMVKWAQSFTNTQDDAFNFLDAGFAQIRWQRRRQQGFNYMFWLTRWGSDFLPAMGFFTRLDYWQTLNRLAYDWFLAERSPLRKISHDVFANLYFRNEDGAMESGIWGSSNTIEFKSGARFYVEVLGNYEDLRVPLAFPEATGVPQGSYTFYVANLNYTTAQGRRLRAEFSVGGGDFYDGRRLDLGVSPSWNVSRHLELGAEYQAHFVRFSDRHEGFDAHILRLRTRVALDTKVSASAFVQYSNVADLVSANVRFRYNFGERNDLWIVYNEGLTLDRRRFDPTLPLTDHRTILLKYTHTFSL